MAAEENLPYGRSLSRASRSAYDISLEQRSKPSKKAQHKYATDKLVWFSPVHSPLLSPAREKTLKLVKKKVRSDSIFSIQSRAKGSVEAEEPTSPKVSCIGQVRACKKDKDSLAETNKKKAPQSKPGSMSPARFFASPGRARKWSSLFSTRKESCATPSSAEAEVSWFNRPFASHSVYQSDSTGGFLLQECGNSDEISYEKMTQVVQLHARASDYESCGDKARQLCIHGADGELERQDPWAVGRGFSDRYTHDATDSRVFGDARPFSVDAPHILQNGEASISCERDKDGKKSVLHGSAHHEASVQEQQHCHGKLLPASKQRLTYEELPSLHCGTSMKPDMKISVEVVPETWLWRNRENTQLGTTSQHCSLPETSTSAGTSGGDAQRVEEEERMRSVFSCGKSQLHSQEEERCMDSQVSLHADIVDKADAVHEVTDLDPVDNGTCKPVHIDSERQNESAYIDSERQDESACMHMDGDMQANPILSSMCVCKEEIREVTHSDGEDRSNGAQADQHGSVGHEKVKDEVDGEKLQLSVGLFESKNRQRRPRKAGPDVGKENYGMVPAQMVEKKLPLPSTHANEDGKRLWKALKGRKGGDSISAQPFSALILVGYEQAMASNENIQKGTQDEEFFKGVLEVGRLSFHSSAKYFQVLKSDAEFIRSRSATSHRTVITMQRCNSDPCRPSH